MIKINLCPDDELLSPTWFVPDLLVLAAVGIGAYLGLQYYLGTIQDQIDAHNSEIASKTSAIAALKDSVDKYANLSREKEQLNVKLRALKSITVSRIAKYKPVIVLERLQNLKPEGAWYTALHIGSDSKFEIVGAAFDNILAAELITALRATQSQDADGGDLRTQIYFSELNLDQTTLTQGGGGFPDIPFHTAYTIRGMIAERSTGPEATTSTPTTPLSLGETHDDEAHL